MPTFFGRKYMRGRPPVTERLIGGSILVLLGLIVCLFLITSGLFSGVVERVPPLARLKTFIGISEKPLFVAAPENAARPLPPPELRVAAALLPELPAPWSRTTVQAADSDQALASRPGDLPPEVAERLHRVFKSYDAGLVLRAEYRRQDDRIQVTIADLATPEAAFGAWRELQPAEAQPLPVGCAGWRIDGHSAFWAGRYYTDIVGPGAAQEEIARTLGSMQLTYGPPFWAESVLPRDGRVERSLRYVKKAALGVEELNDCWLAEYPGGVTLGVVRAGAPAKLLQALGERLKNGAPEPAAPAEAGYGDAPGGYEGGGEDAHEEATSPPAEGNLTAGLGEHAVSGRLADKVATAFGAGPYVFVAVSGDVGAMQALAQAVHDRWASSQAIASVQAAQGPESPGGPGQTLFPEVSGANVLAPTKIERYTDNLYEKINGREGQFRSFNFVELRFGQYVDSRSRQSFDVYVYDMAEPLNAMGIYKAEQSESPELLELGREGYVSGPNVYFWKSRYYVNVLGAVEGGEAAAETARKIAGAIAENITDEAGGIWAEALLPKEDLVPGSLSYRASSGLGHEFLQELFVADYKSGGTEYQMFILRQPDAEGARRVFAQFADATAQYDKVVSREATDGGETLVGESSGVFTVAFQRGIYFGGVTECDDKDLALRRAAGMREALPAGGTGPAPAPAPAKPKPQPADESEGGEHEY